MAVLIGHESHKGAVWAVKRSRMLHLNLIDLAYHFTLPHEAAIHPYKFTQSWTILRPTLSTP